MRCNLLFCCCFIPVCGAPLSLISFFGWYLVWIFWEKWRATPPVFRSCLRTYFCYHNQTLLPAMRENCARNSITTERVCQLSKPRFNTTTYRHEETNPKTTSKTLWIGSKGRTGGVCVFASLSLIWTCRVSVSCFLAPCRRYWNGMAPLQILKTPNL